MQEAAPLTYEFAAGRRFQSSKLKEEAEAFAGHGEIMEGVTARGVPSTILLR